MSFKVAFAEYRVYQYYVKSTNDIPRDQESYLILSTLDPVSYVSYHGGSSSVRVDLVRTWTCKGHTGGAPLCPGPFESSPEQGSI